MSLLTGIYGGNWKMPIIAAYQHQEPGEYIIMVYMHFDFMLSTLHENFKGYIINCGTYLEAAHLF